MNRTRRPTHPGIAFNELVLAPLNRSTEDAAKTMGVCQSYLESVLSGDIPVTRDLAEKMDELTNTPADSWMSIQTILDEWERDLAWSEFRPTEERLQEIAQAGADHLGTATDDELATALEYAKETLSAENIRAEVEKTREILESNPMPFGKKKSWLRRLFSWK